MGWNCPECGQSDGEPSGYTEKLEKELSILKNGNLCDEAIKDLTNKLNFAEVALGAADRLIGKTGCACGDGELCWFHKKLDDYEQTKA